MTTKKKSRKPKASKKERRKPKRLSFTLYSYVEPMNGKYAKTVGKEKCGSFSAYVDKLIAADRKRYGTKNKTGTAPKAIRRAVKRAVAKVAKNVHALKPPQPKQDAVSQAA